MGLQQQNTNDQNCLDDSAEWSTSADWQAANVEDKPAMLAISVKMGLIEISNKQLTEVHLENVRTFIFSLIAIQ